jgi:hypothetical protein
MDLGRSIRSVYRRGYPLLLVDLSSIIRGQPARCPSRLALPAPMLADLHCFISIGCDVEALRGGRLRPKDAASSHVAANEWIAARKVPCRPSAADG